MYNKLTQAALRNVTTLQSTSNKTKHNISNSTSFFCQKQQVNERGSRVWPPTQHTRTESYLSINYTDIAKRTHNNQQKAQEP